MIIKSIKCFIQNNQNLALNEYLEWVDILDTDKYQACLRDSGGWLQLASLKTKLIDPDSLNPDLLRITEKILPEEPYFHSHFKDYHDRTRTLYSLRHRNTVLLTSYDKKSVKKVLKNLLSKLEG